MNKVLRRARQVSLGVSVAFLTGSAVWAGGPVGSPGADAARTYGAAAKVAAGTGLVAVTSGRFDADGDVDLVVLNRGAKTVSLLSGNGRGGFGRPVAVAAAADPVAAAAADFNGDGALDLAVADGSSGNVTVHFGNASGGFRAAKSFAAGPNLSSLAVGDFNGDSWADLAVASRGTNSVSVLLGNGKGAFGAPISRKIGASPISIASGDFDNNGTADLAVVHQGRKGVSVLLGDGAGSFGPSTRFIVSPTPASGAVAVADFDGDGNSDLLVAKQGRNRVSVMLGDGRGNFGAIKSYASHQAVTSGDVGAATADLDGDGTPDIALANSDGDSLSILLSSSGRGHSRGDMQSANSDTTPQPFAFNDQTGVVVGSVRTSNAVAITGIDAATPISVVGGSYSIGCNGTFTTVDGTINNQQTVCVQHTASSSFSTAVDTTLTVGGISDTFTSTTRAADTTPKAFSFIDQTNVVLSSVRTSNAITVAEINTAAPISVTGGGYSVGCTASYITTPGTVTAGQTVCVQHTASGTPSTSVNTTLTIGGVSDTFTSTTRAADTTPKQFSFVDQTGVALSSVRTSNAITVSQINAPASIGVTGGSYSIGCTASFVTGANTISAGQTVCVRHTASANPTTAVNTTLTIGGVSDTFTSTTRAGDTTPKQFSFVDQTGVPVSSVRTSNAITVAQINAPASIGVSGGSYSIGCTATYLTGASTVTSGQTVCVRHTSSSSFSTAVNTVLTIGGVSDTFTSTTVAADTTPNQFSFADQKGVPLNSVRTSSAVTINGINSAASVSVTGGSYSVGCTATYVTTVGTITKGQTICARNTSSTNFNTAVNTVVTIGGVSDTFTTTTLKADTTPSPFSFVDQTNVTPGSVRTSNAITIAGINSPANVSVSGGSYSVGCTATFVTTAGTISNNQTICVRHTASASFSTATNTVLTIGGVSDTFTSTTIAGDTTPTNFSFVDQTNVPPGSVRTSNTISITGINTPTPVSISGGSYSIGCTATFITTGSNITNGQTICVRHTASSGFVATTDTVLTIGTVSDTFSSTTQASDKTPAEFIFNDQGDVPVGSVRTSDAVQIQGINDAAPVTITGGTYNVSATSTCGATYVSTAGTITNGQWICARHTSSATAGTTVNTLVTIGGVSDTFSSTTAQ